MDATEILRGIYHLIFIMICLYELGNIFKIYLDNKIKEAIK
jgi:hypothetical protein